MTTEICVSNWKKSLEKSVLAEETRLNNLRQELAAKQEEAHQCFYVESEKYSICQSEIQRLKNSINLQEGSLQQLKKRNELCVPSAVVGQIETLNTEITSQINAFEQRIASITKKRDGLIGRIAPIKEKVEIAQQFGSTTEATQTLKELEIELAEVTNQFEILQQEYRVFSIAKNHQNDACLVSEDTPGYRMRALRSQLKEEKNTFTDDIENKVNVLYEEIDTAINTIVKAAQTIGEITITVKARDLELKSIGLDGTGLQDKLKSIQLKSDLKNRTLQQIVDAKRFVD